MSEEGRQSPGTEAWWRSVLTDCGREAALPVCAFDAAGMRRLVDNLSRD
jgi:hypothetical protein